MFVSYTVASAIIESKINFGIGCNNTDSFLRSGRAAFRSPEVIKSD